MSKKPVVSAKTEGTTRRKVASKLIGTVRAAVYVAIDTLHDIAGNMQINVLGVFQNAICTYRDRFLLTEKKHIGFRKVGTEETTSANGNQTFVATKRNGKVAYSLLYEQTPPRDSKTGEWNARLLDCSIVVNLAPTFGGLKSGELAWFTLGRDISLSKGTYGKAHTILTVDLDPAVFVGTDLNRTLFTIILMMDRFAEKNLLETKKVTKSYSDMLEDPLFAAMENDGRLMSTTARRQQYRNAQEDMDQPVDLVGEEMHVPVAKMDNMSKGLVPPDVRKYIFTIAGSIDDVFARKISAAEKRAETARRKAVLYRDAGVPDIAFSISRKVDAKGNIKPFDATQFQRLLDYFPEPVNVQKLIAYAVERLEERNPEVAYATVRSLASKMLENVQPAPDLYAEPNGEHTPAGKPRTVGKESKNGSRSTKTRRKAAPVEAEAAAFFKSVLMKESK